MQRAKGAAGEREVLALLGDRLGKKFERNLGQTRGGGADCVEIGRIALEVKRQEQLNIKSWWEQAERQAVCISIPSGIDIHKKQQLNAIPVLAYRQSRKPWTFVLDCKDVCLLDVRGHLIQMDLETFCLLGIKMNFLET